MPSFSSTTRPADALRLRVIRAPQVRHALIPRYVTRVAEGFRALGATIRDGLPWTATSAEARAYRWANLWHMLGDVPGLALGILLTSRKNYGVLRLTLRRASGELVEFGVVSHRLVTTAGVNKLVALMNGTDAATGAAFKYHGIGTGATAPAIGDTALQTESTTALNPDNTRATGSQTTGGASNIYRSVGTVTVDASVANTEYGLLSQAATGGGTLLDRFTYSVVNLANGDSLQGTVDITLPAGS